MRHAAPSRSPRPPCARGIAGGANVGIRPIEGDGGRVLMQPGYRNRRGPQSLERHGTKDLIEVRGKQRIENLSQARIMD